MVVEPAPTGHTTKLSGWIGVAVFHKNPYPILQVAIITSADGLCPYSLKGPGNVSSHDQQEVNGAGAAFMLENQEKIGISFDVTSLFFRGLQ